MSEENSGNSLAQGLGIAGLVTGIIALIVSFIPCFGIYAFWIGILGALLAGGAIYIASKENLSKGLAIAALVVSILAMTIAFMQYRALSKVGSEFEKSVTELNEQLKEAAENQ